MLKKILIATDLSDSSFNLVQCLTALKSFGVESVVLTHVIDTKYGASIPRKLVDQSENILDEQADLLAAAGLTVRADLREDVPWTGILESARERGVDLVVVGSHGRSIAADVVLGSVTSELIERADLPVLVVKMSIADRKSKTRRCSAKVGKLFDSVLVPTDFSDENAAALDFVKAMRVSTGDITLVHVQEPIILEQPIEFDIQELDAIDCNRLRELGRRFGPAANLTEEVLHGLPSVELTDYIRAGEFTLVVMGTRGMGPTARFILGSVSRYVIRHSDTPVLIVPKKKGRRPRR